jgi:sigma-E factor negative regulatory protein RseB
LIFSRSSYKYPKTGPTGLFLFVLTVAGLFSTSSMAQDRISNSLDPKMLYERMLDSKALYDYEGILTFEQAGQMQSFEVSSRQAGMALDQKLNQLDGPRQEHFLRFDAECQPKQGASVDQFDNYYNFFSIGEERVAGRTGTEIVLMPVDKYRNGFQFVVDNETGLMLRAVVTAPDRRVLERTQFVSIDFERREEPVDAAPGENAESAETIADSADTEAESVEDTGGSAQASPSSEGEEIASNVDPVDTTQQADASVEPDSISCNYFSIENGWAAGWVPEGFNLLQSSLQDERATMVYGDGISLVSVFIEPVQETFLPPSNAQRGATAIYINYLSTRTNTYLVSVVGEVPMETAERIFSSLRRQ